MIFGIFPVQGKKYWPIVSSYNPFLSCHSELQMTGLEFSAHKVPLCCYTAPLTLQMFGNFVEETFNHQSVGLSCTIVVLFSMF